MSIKVKAKIFINIFNDKRNHELVIYVVNSDSSVYFFPDTVSLSGFGDTLLVGANNQIRTKDGKRTSYYMSNSYLPSKMIKLFPNEVVIKKIHHKKLQGINNYNFLGIRIYIKDFDELLIAIPIIGRCPFLSNMKVRTQLFIMVKF